MRLILLFGLPVIFPAAGTLLNRIPIAFNISQAAQDGTAKAPLETITAKLPEVKGTRVATTTQYEKAGGKSTVRIKAIEAKFNITSDLKTSGTGPASAIQLFKPDSSKNKKTFSLTPDNRVAAVEIPVSIQAEDNLNFRITVFTAPGAGEYAFVDKTSVMANGNVMVFAFGID